MSIFWLVATLMTAAALAFFAPPLWRQRRASGRWTLAGIAAAAAIVPIAFALYLHVSNWAPDAARADAAGRRMVDGLAARLAQAPEDPAGWQMLGRSYLALGEAAKARDAYREAWARSPAPASSLKVALAEAEVLADRATLGGAAGRMFEQVLEVEPDNMKALWYGGLAAVENGREDLAKERWSKLLELGPPREIRERIEAQGVAAPAGAARAQPTPAAASAPERAQEQPVAAASAAITLDVRLGAGLAPRPDATLFIFARAPGGGPPVAVLRRSGAALPGRFTLSAADSMIPGRSLADFAMLTIVARLSASGEPAERSGDAFAQADAAPGSAVELVIDRLVP